MKTARNTKKSIFRVFLSVSCFILAFPSYRGAFQSFQTIDCSIKIRYICKIEVLFPDGCFHPFLITAKGGHERTIHWKARTPLPGSVKSNFSIASTASKANRDPGRPYYFKCGRNTYMGIMEEFPRLKGVDFCQSKGMQMLSVKNTTEMKCIQNFFKETISSSYWTSGVNFGTTNATTYGWCSTGKMVDGKLWAEGEPRDPERKRCVALTVMEGEPQLSGLEAVPCNFEMPLICQLS